jgi:hypothetical protein
MITGSCLCGQVRYAADADVEAIVHCHCHTCRKTHGSAFSSVAAVPRRAFRWTAGESLLKAFESSPGKLRRFCTACGSHVMAERLDSENVLLRLGCLDTEIEAPERQWHIWRSDAASWYDPAKPLPTLPEGLKR